MGSSDLKLELNKEEAKKSAYFSGGVLREKKVQSPTAGSEVVLPKESEPEEVIVDKKFVAEKLEKIANILNSTIERSKAFITAQKTMDKKDKKMCTPPPPPNPKKRKEMREKIKALFDKRALSTEPEEEEEKLYYQGNELRREDQVEPVYFETIHIGEFDPTIRLEGSALQNVELPIAEMLTNLSIKAYSEAIKKGKWNGVTINDAILWLVSEVLELYRATERGEGNIEEELADVIIMALSIAGKMKVDIGREIERKMRKNAQK